MGVTYSVAIYKHCPVCRCEWQTPVVVSVGDHVTCMACSTQMELSVSGVLAPLTNFGILPVEARVPWGGYG